MDFFQHQDIAKRNTRWLVVFFLLAIACLIAITTAAVVLTFYFFQFNSDTAVRAMDANSGMFAAAWQMMTWEVLASISAVVVSVVAIGCLYKFSQLSGGGKKVAEAMGGRLLSGDSRDADERKILNVVEEMAIASGTPVPPVYLMEDDSINAFAAGFKPQDAVIGITRGCIRLLNRDELQGVVAHEFSHILHGDMRLNIRLIGVLHGILSIGLIGYFLFRSTAYSSMGRSRRGNSVGGLIFLGFALIIVGYAGTFFGNIIKAAVSRQREFLADSSAVQFTRNPSGIGGALKKIGGYPAGSLLQSPSATEFSHMYFGQGIVTHFSRLMATHPPLKDRILRIEPRWKGSFPSVSMQTKPNDTEEGVSHFQSQQATSAAALDKTAVESIGQPSSEHLDYAHNLVNKIDIKLKEAAHNPFSARALVYCLLLDKKSSDIRQQQWRILQQQADPRVFKAARQLEKLAHELSADKVLPLVDMCIPSLKQMSPDQHKVFKGNIIGLIRADNSVSLFEWSLYRILIHNLESPKPSKSNYSIKHCVEECRVLLSMLAHSGHSSLSHSQSAFEHSFATLGVGSRFFFASSDIGLSELDKALDKLKQLKPLQKPMLLKALVECISFDQKITTSEAELFRAIADSLDCPVPPLLEQQKLA